jgi:hypothetical protein
MCLVDPKTIEICLKIFSAYILGNDTTVNSTIKKKKHYYSTFYLTTKKIMYSLSFDGMASKISVMSFGSLRRKAIIKA